MLGLSQTGKKDPHSVIDLHRQAIELFNSIGDRHSQAIALNAIGQVYEFTKQPQLALEHYEQALRLFEAIGSLDGVSVSTFKVAQARRLLGQEDQALVDLERCLKLSRVARKRRTEANALNEIGAIYVAQKRTDLAIKHFQRIDRFYESIGDHRGQATALDTYGDLLLKTGQKQNALAAYGRALLLSRQVDDKVALLTALYSFASVNLELGFPDVALSTIRESLLMIEDLRANVASPDFRTSYFSGVQKHYDLGVRILMQLHRLRPMDGFAVEAFLVDSKGRARALNDMIAESQMELREGVPDEIIKREREIRASLRAMAQYEWDLRLNNGDTAETAEVSARRTKLLLEHQEIAALLRRGNSPERSALSTLAQVQKELQDPDALLLQYALDDERSYLWAVTSNSFQIYELPAGNEIEDMAREFYSALTARQSAIDQDYEARIEAADNLVVETGSRLSEMLLAPVAGQLNSRKVLVATQGALQFIPFDALPVPGSDKTNTPQLLVETNDVSVLPSVSTLIAIRAMPSRTGSPDKTVAVLADPVFSDSDDRVQTGEVSSALASAAPQPSLHPSVQQSVDRAMRDSGASRLIYSSEEADAISAAAPSGTTIVFKGFDATRDVAMSSDVGQYQIVHFATHGFFNSEHPELSAIVLTSVDRNGVKTNGLMPLHDIYSLDLGAELTVLSACQTALGKDIKGEGPVGLTHSFISAGSKSVVASLWKMDDRATAALMSDFYGSLLREGMPTSKALRSAKLKMLRDKRWSAPYHWAGFVLQGEYTNRIAVDNSWRRHRLVVVLSLVVIAVGLLIVFRVRKRRFDARPY
jgi:CHAT domain-containing protein